MPTAPKGLRQRMLEQGLIRRANPDRRAEFKRREAVRGDATQRGYGGAWKRISAAYLARHPRCAVRGCKAAAAIVDHVLPIRCGGDHREANLQSLCRSCHAKKTTLDKRRYPLAYPSPGGAT